MLIEIKDELVADLLAHSLCESLPNVLARALAIYQVALEHVQSGGTVIFRDQDGKEETAPIL
jgi:hypothetical protein